MIAAVMCVTQESVAGKEKGKTGNDDISYFQQGRNWISEKNAADVAKTTRAFLLGDEANVGGTGGVKGWKQRHGSLRASAGDLNAMITAVQISVGGYGRWQSDATKAVDIWMARNGGDSATSEPEGSTVAVYQFRRGEAGGQREDSWTAGQRLAGEVNFDLFAVANTIWYASDRELAASRPVADFHRDDRAVIDITWDQDARMAVDECHVTITWDDPWELTPGMPVMVSGEKFADGRWIVDEAEIRFLEFTTNLTLRRPGRKKREPAPEVQTTPKSSRTTNPSLTARGGADPDVEDVYRTALAIAKSGIPYGPGGHGQRWAAAAKAKTMDCSSSTSVALYGGGMMGRANGPQVSDYFLNWGVPGEGQEMTVWVKPGAGANGHVFIDFPKKGKRFDTGGPGGGAGPRVRDRARPTGGFHPRHFPGT
jgi:hypothetical protein